MKFKKILKKMQLLLLLLAFCFVQSNAQSIKGKWWGQLNLQDFHLRIELVIDSADNAYKASVISVDQSNTIMPATSFTYNYPDIDLKGKRNLSIVGSVDPLFNKITCQFQQRQVTQKVIFTHDSIPPDENSLSAIKLRYIKKEVYITMRDGKKLFTSYYTPKDSTTKHPILMYRTPYNIEPGGVDEYNYFMTAFYRYVKENYIMVFQDVRGKYMSEGDFEDIRPFIANRKNNKDIDDASDTYDAVDWLVKNVPNNNGNVGLFGVSYPGFYSTMGILAKHPAIKAVSPQAPVTAWFLGDDFHHNGAFFLLDCFHFDYSFSRARKGLTREYEKSFDWPVSDNYKFFNELGAVQNIKKKYFGDSIQFWNEAFEHPNYDDFWKARDPRPHLKNITAAVMTVGGWFDAEDLYGTLHTYKAIEEQNPPTTNNFLVMGPWSHGQWSSGKAERLGNIAWGFNTSEMFQNLEVKFFDYYLRGVGKNDFAEANIFITGQNKWTTFNTWPPKNTTSKQLYLQTNGKLSFTSPTENESYDEYMSDPKKPVPYSEKVHQNRTREYMDDDQRFAAKRPDVMSYQSDVLTEDITLTGPLNANLFVSTTGTDADYVVKLIDVFPEDMEAPEGVKVDVPLGGYQMMIRGEVFRGRYRKSFEKPEPFVPGKITTVNYDLPDIAHTFKKGHRIMIQIQNSWFPLVDSNPQKFVDIYKCTDADFQKATHRIYHDKKNPSSIKVMVLN